MYYKQIKHYIIRKSNTTSKKVRKYNIHEMKINKQKIKSKFETLALDRKKEWHLLHAGLYICM